MVRMMREMVTARALANESGKVLLFYNPNPDIVEVKKFVELLRGDDGKITTIDGRNEAELNYHLERGTENVLVTNGDQIPLSFQLVVGDPELKWPRDWSILASTDGGNRMQPRGPWASCFAANAIWRSKKWKNIEERSWREVLELAKHVFNAEVMAEGVFMVSSNAFEPIEPLVRKRMLRGLGDVLDIANAACLAATQDQRRTVSSADVIVAIAAKSRGSSNHDGPNQATLAAALAP